MTFELGDGPGEKSVVLSLRPASPGWIDNAVVRIGNGAPVRLGTLILPQEGSMESVLRGAAVDIVVLIIMRLAGRRTLGEIASFYSVLLLLTVAETAQQGLLGGEYSVTSAAVLTITLFTLDIGIICEAFLPGARQVHGRSADPPGSRRGKGQPGFHEVARRHRRHHARCPRRLGAGALRPDKARGAGGRRQYQNHSPPLIRLCHAWHIVAGNDGGFLLSRQPQANKSAGSHMP